MPRCLAFFRAFLLTTMVCSSRSAAAQRPFQMVVVPVVKSNMSPNISAMSASTFFLPPSCTMKLSAFFPNEVPGMPGRSGSIVLPHAAQSYTAPMWHVVSSRMRSSKNSVTSLQRVSLRTRHPTVWQHGHRVRTCQCFLSGLLEWLLPAWPPPSERAAWFPAAAFSRSASRSVPSSSAIAASIFLRSSFTLDLRSEYWFLPEVLWWAYRRLSSSRSAVTLASSAAIPVRSIKFGLTYSAFRASRSAATPASLAVSASNVRSGLARIPSRASCSAATLASSAASMASSS